MSRQLQLRGTVFLIIIIIAAARLRMRQRLPPSSRGGGCCCAACLSLLSALCLTLALLQGTQAAQHHMFGETVNGTCKVAAPAQPQTQQGALWSGKHAYWQLSACYWLHDKP
jgi:hypothetical protein